MELHQNYKWAINSSLRKKVKKTETRVSTRVLLEATFKRLERAGNPRVNKGVVGKSASF